MEKEIDPTGGSHRSKMSQIENFGEDWTFICGYTML